MLNRLIYCGNGEKVTIKELQGGPGAVFNLKTYGLAIGNTINVIKNELDRGPIFISNDNEIIEVGLEFSKKIIVESEDVSDFKLNKAFIGDIVEITKMRAKGEIRRRLMDMGIVKGTKMTVIRVAPLGDPIELRVGNFNLSLRLSEAEDISVKLIEIGRDSISVVNNAV